MWEDFHIPLSSLPKTLPKEMEVKDSEALVDMVVANCIIFATVHFLTLQEAYTEHGIFLTSCEVI